MHDIKKCRTLQQVANILTCEFQELTNNYFKTNFDMRTMVIQDGNKEINDVEIQFNFDIRFLHYSSLSPMYVTSLFNNAVSITLYGCYVEASIHRCVVDKESREIVMSATILLKKIEWPQLKSEYVNYKLLNDDIVNF